MDLKMFLTVFATVFLAEIGDKTQLATLLFAADREINKWWVFAASALALIVCAAIGVICGAALSNWINERVLAIIAGSGFIIIGGFILVQALSAGKTPVL